MLLKPNRELHSLFALLLIQYVIIPYCVICINSSLQLNIALDHGLAIVATNIVNMYSLKQILGFTIMGFTMYDLYILSTQILSNL